MKRYLTLLVLPFAALVVPASAQAAACSGTTGVTVVVQFPDNHTEIGCDPGNPSTGFGALTGAGFQLTYVNNSAFLCRVDGQPSSDQCQRTPPADAYWGYFHAQRGGSWSYSNEGGGSYDPSPGTVEGWRFQTTTAPQPPSTKPPASIKSTPKPTPKPKPTVSAHATPSVEPVETSPTPTKHASANPSAPNMTASTGPAPNGPGPSLTPTTMLQNRAAGAADKQAPAASSHGVSWIWGAVLLAVLAAAGSVTAVRRRRG